MKNSLSNHIFIKHLKYAGTALGSEEKTVKKEILSSRSLQVNALQDPFVEIKDNFRAVIKGLSETLKVYIAGYQFMPLIIISSSSHTFDFDSMTDITHIYVSHQIPISAARKTIFFVY